MMILSNKKKALVGFDRVTLFPVTKNDTEGYAVGEKFPLPYAEELTRETDVSEQKFYADDGLYLNVKNFNGINATLTLMELSYEDMEKLGFGEYNTETETFIANPQGANKEFAMTFRSENVSNEYRMYKFFCFTVNEIKETGSKTKGGSANINKYQIIGTFTRRSCDGEMYQQKDAKTPADMQWLDSISTVN